jgi:hypothetical protein
MATVIWCITVCLMPWMIPARQASSLALPLPAPVILWSIAALTIAFAWPARYNTNRGWGVLTVSLLVVAGFFLALR